jgi:hypothetical protein
LELTTNLGKVNVVANIWSRRTHLSQLEVEKMPTKLCSKINRLNLRIVTNAEVMEMEEHFTLGYTKRSTGRREDLGNRAQYQGGEVSWFYER